MADLEADVKALKTLSELLRERMGRYEQRNTESHPPAGMLKVKNLYINPSTGKLIVEYEDVPV